MPRLNLSRIVILCAGVSLGLWIIRMLAGAPPIIIGAGLLLDAIISIAFFRVDWDYYWATLPNRIGSAMWVIRKYIWFFLGGEAAGAVLLWYADSIKPGGDAVMFGILGLMCVWVTSITSLAALFLPAIIALIANPKGMPDGRRMVANQDVHGSADYADARAVDAALKGASASPAPTQTRTGYRYED